jgi:hypothetical protein
MKSKSVQAKLDELLLLVEELHAMLDAWGDAMEVQSAE